MKEYKDIYYTKEESSARMLDIYTPDGDGFTTFLYFHGGGLEHGTKRGSGTPIIADYLCAKGIAVVSAEYRMYPDAAYPDFINDAADALKWVLDNIGKYGGGDNVIVGGSSAGAYLSMMLCFDTSYLKDRGISPDRIGGYLHNAGQPTTHYNILRERGLDTRRSIIDEAAPLFHVGLEKEYPRMLFIVSDDDMKCRYEQTRLIVATMAHFGCDTGGVEFLLLEGKHCAHCSALDESGESVFGKIIYEFLSE
jgi:dipeptidyl aminopeptidase/acylaminoacyl peptidase